MKPSLDEVTVNSRKYDGKLKRSWKVRPVNVISEPLYFIGEFREEVSHPDLGLIRRGTISHEYFWFERWFNIFRFHDPEGALRYYYCNIIMPPSFEADILDYVDLDIDILVAPDLSYRVLDLEEFEANVKLLHYPRAIVTAAKRTLEELLAEIEGRRFPDSIISSEP